MQVTWDPENGDEKQIWTFDPEDVLRKDATLIEKHFGGTWDQWRAGLVSGDIAARTVLLWYMLKLIHPTIRFDDVPDFRIRQLTVQMGMLELKKLYERVQKMKLSESTREAFNAQIELDMKEAMEREGIEGEVTINDNQLAIDVAVPGDDLPKAP